MHRYTLPWHCMGPKCTPHNNCVIALVISYNTQTHIGRVHAACSPSPFFPLLWGQIFRIAVHLNRKARWEPHPLTLHLTHMAREQSAPAASTEILKNPSCRWGWALCICCIVIDSALVPCCCFRRPQIFIISSVWPWVSFPSNMRFSPLESLLIIHNF